MYNRCEDFKSYKLHVDHCEKKKKVLLYRGSLAGMENPAEGYICLTFQKNYLRSCSRLVKKKAEILWLV